MKTFNDNAARSWTVQINVDAIRRVRDLASVNLLEVIEGKLIERLVSDPILLCDVIYVVCKPEADAREISDADFGRAMAGDAIDSATTALLEELVSFFPQAKRRVLAKALAKLQNLQRIVSERAESMLESPDLEQQILRQLDELDREAQLSPSNSSGNAPESSALSPPA
jgi:hypothetical protein